MEAPPQLKQPPRIGEHSAGPSSRGLIAVTLLLGGFAILVFACVTGITGYFRLSSDAGALSSSVMRSIPGQWEKKIALRVGPFTTALARAGAGLFSLPPEARNGLSAVQGAEVGIYELASLEQATPLRLSAFREADRAMERRGWVRTVGVLHDQELVAVYFPRAKMSSRSIRCCVLVFQGRQLIVAGVRGNLDPLMELVRNSPEFKGVKQELLGAMKTPVTLSPAS
jgi:hypothetical protein